MVLNVPVGGAAPATLQSSLACRLASEEQMLSGPAPQPRRVQTAPPIQEAPRFPPSSFLPALAYWISLTTQFQCSDSGEMLASDPSLLPYLGAPLGANVPSFVRQVGVCFDCRVDLRGQRVEGAKGSTRGHRWVPLNDACVFLLRSRISPRLGRFQRMRCNPCRSDPEGPPTT